MHWRDKDEQSTHSSISNDFWIFRHMPQDPQVELLRFDSLENDERDTSAGARSVLLGGPHRLDQLLLMNASLPSLPPSGGRNILRGPRIVTRPPLQNVSGITNKQGNCKNLFRTSRRKQQDKTKKRVRLRLPGETCETGRVDPFADNWLVDTPRLILSEKTTIGMSSALQEELEAFYVEVAHVDETEYDLPKECVAKLTYYVMRKLNLMELDGGLKVSARATFVGSLYDSTQVIGIGDIDVLIGFSIHDARIESVQPGYNIIPLPRHRDKEGGPGDKYGFGRSLDGQYLSSRKVAKVFYDLVKRALRKKSNAVVQPFTLEEGKSQITVLLNQKYHVNFLPAAWDPILEGHLIPRPYIYDENPGSDMMWRLIFAQNERHLMQTMDMADRGARVKVYKIMKALIRLEHTLHGLLGYHIKTVLLHAFDSDVDSTPRWQRGNIEHCFMSVLKQLKHYLYSKNLPHFFIRGQNLFENMPERTLTNLRNRIAYLVSNPRECTRIIKKRPEQEHVDDIGQGESLALGRSTSRRTV